MKQTNRSRKAGRGGRRWTSEQAAEVVSQWKASGLSLAAFSRGRGITAQRISWWRDRLAGRDRPAPLGTASEAGFRFVPAVVRGCALASGEAAVTIRLPGGGCVEVAEPARVSAEWLSMLVRGCEEERR